VLCEGSRSLDLGPGVRGLCIEKHGLQRLKNPGENLLLLRLVLPLANMDLDAVRAEFEQFSPRTDAPKTSCANADALERVPGGDADPFQARIPRRGQHSVQALDASNTKAGGAKKDASYS
jgi:hypothetical protein